MFILIFTVSSFFALGKAFSTGNFLLVLVLLGGMVFGVWAQIKTIGPSTNASDEWKVVLGGIAFFALVLMAVNAGDDNYNGYGNYGNYSTYKCVSPGCRNRVISGAYCPVHKKKTPTPKPNKPSGITSGNKHKYSGSSTSSNYNDTYGLSNYHSADDFADDWEDDFDSWDDAWDYYEENQ